MVKKTSYGGKEGGGGVMGGGGRGVLSNLGGGRKGCLIQFIDAFVGIHNYKLEMNDM